MSNPFKFFKHLEQKIFLGVIGLELLKTLVFPNPIDVLILIGLIIIYFWSFADDWH